MRSTHEKKKVNTLESKHLQRCRHRHSHGRWKREIEGRSVANDQELQNALEKNENTKSKVQGCLACEYGINVSHGPKHKRC